mmetsp:Transcript_91796/g.153858  ORF Transcript_91796/g.153858 Transcript_91796/m.153858 type:complete len:332 (-) Transcript_91796:452-1447(-)
MGGALWWEGAHARHSLLRPLGRSHHARADCAGAGRAIRVGGDATWVSRECTWGGVVHGVATHGLPRRRSLRPTACHAAVPCSVLHFQRCLAHLLALCHVHVQRLGAQHVPVHFADCLVGCLRILETDETKSLANWRRVLVQGNLHGCDLSEFFKGISQSLFIHGVIQILHVQIGSTVLVHLACTQLAQLFAQFLHTLALLLRTLAIQLLFFTGTQRLNILIVTLLHSFAGLLVSLEGNKRKRATLLVGFQTRARDFPKGAKMFLDGIFNHTFLQFLDVQVGIRVRSILLTKRTTIERANVHLQRLQQHAIHLLNGRLRRLFAFEVHKAVPA